MLTERHDQDQPTPRVQLSTYQPATAARPGHIFVELRVDRESNPANLARQRAAEERLNGGTDQVCGSIDNVATRHLRELTGTKARIIDDGYAVTIEMDVPAAPVTEKHGTGSGGGINAGHPLTADQESALPELVRSIDAALPPHERHHSETLAHMVAQEIPSTADVVRSSDRVTLAEIIEGHERRMDSYTQMPLPASLRIAKLSFPQHPSAALHQSATTTTGPASTARSHHTAAPGLER